MQNLMQVASVLVAVALFGLIIFLILTKGISLIIDYEVGPNGIDAVLLHLFRVPMLGVSSIDNVRELSFTGYTESNPFRTLRLGNRWRRRFVVVERNGSFIKRVLLTPKDPTSFTHSLLQLKRSQPTAGRID